MKTYLLISPQPWGKMYLSKHNYAIELADAGHKVYFLNPPTYKKVATKLDIKVKEELPNVFTVDYFLSSPMHILRFKARPMYEFIMRHSLIRQLNKLAKFDELWCFDPNIFSSFKPFNAKKKLLFVVDQHDNSTVKKLANEADGIATISSLILDYFNFSNRPKLLLNHGLNKTFTALAKQRLNAGLSNEINNPIKIAYVGNLLQAHRMDYKTLRTIIEENDKIHFHIYGPYEEKNNTLGSSISEELKQFLDFLKKSPNVHLHGILAQNKLAVEVQQMDGYLTCYDYLIDYNKSSNCHKIIEYLSVGKVCVANRIITYETIEGMIEMPDEYTNENLPALFKKVISNLADYNSPARQQHRINFALENTYAQHIKTITKFMEEPVPIP